MATTTHYSYTKPAQGATSWGATWNTNLDNIDDDIYAVTFLSNTRVWDPGSVADGAMTSITLTVTGATVGNPVAVGFSVAVPAGALLVGAVTAADTVTVTLFNKTGGVLDLASGTLKANVWT